jgi:hypothetical protein
LIFDDKTVPASLTRNINSVEVNMKQKKYGTVSFVFKVRHKAVVIKFDANLNYDLSDDYQFSFGYQNLNKLPNDITTVSKVM